MKYEQKFSFDTIGNMTHKKSSEIITPAMQKKDGDDLNYDLTYEYDANYAHRLTRAGRAERAYNKQIALYRRRRDERKSAVCFFER